MKKIIILILLLSVLSNAAELKLLIPNNYYQSEFDMSSENILTFIGDFKIIRTNIATGLQDTIFDNPGFTYPRFFSESGERFLVYQNFDTVKLFDINNKLIYKSSFPKLWNIALSPNGEKIIGSNFSSFFKYDIENNKVLSSFSFGYNTENQALSRYGEIIVDYTDSLISVYNVSENKKINQISVNDYNYEFHVLDISNNGKLIVYSNNINEVIILNSETGEIISKINFQGNLTKIVISHDNSKIVIATETSIQMFHIKNIQKIFEEKFQDLSFPQIIFSNNDEYLMVTDHDLGYYRLRVIEIESAKIVTQPERGQFNSRAQALSSDDSTLISCSDNGIRKWNIVNGSYENEFQFYINPEKIKNNFVISSDGKKLVFHIGALNTIMVMDLENNKYFKTFIKEVDYDILRNFERVANSNSVIFKGSSANVIQMDLENGINLHKIHLIKSYKSVRSTPDGSRLVCLSDSAYLTSVDVYNVQTQELEKSISLNVPFNLHDLHPDNTHIIGIHGGNLGWQPMIVNIETGEAQAILTSNFSMLNYSPQGDKIISLNYGEMKIYIHDSKTFNVVNSFLSPADKDILIPGKQLNLIVVNSENASFVIDAKNGKILNVVEKISYEKNIDPEGKYAIQYTEKRVFKKVNLLSPSFVSATKFNHQFNLVPYIITKDSLFLVANDGAQKNIRIWDLKNQKNTKSFIGNRKGYFDYNAYSNMISFDSFIYNINSGKTIDFSTKYGYDYDDFEHTKFAKRSEYLLATTRQKVALWHTQGFVLGKLNFRNKNLKFSTWKYSEDEIATTDGDKIFFMDIAGKISLKDSIDPDLTVNCFEWIPGTNKIVVLGKKSEHNTMVIYNLLSKKAEYIFVFKREVRDNDCRIFFRKKSIIIPSYKSFYAFNIQDYSYREFFRNPEVPLAHDMNYDYSTDKFLFMTFENYLIQNDIDSIIEPEYLGLPQSNFVVNRNKEFPYLAENIYDINLFDYNGQYIKAIPPTSHLYTNITFSSKGSAILMNNTVLCSIYDLKKGNFLNHFFGYSVTNYNEDNKITIITKSAEITSYDIESDKKLFSIQNATKVDLSSHGKYLAVFSFSEDKVKIYDSRHGSLINIINSPFSKYSLDVFNQISFLEGTDILVTSDNKAIKFWNALTAELLDSINLYAESNGLKSIEYSKTLNKLILIGNNALYVYDLKPDFAMQIIDENNFVKPETIVVLPNPVSGDKITIELPECTAGIYDISISSSDGKILKAFTYKISDKKLILDIPDFLSGTYFCSMCYNGKCYTAKFVVLN